ncbi:hypothetical protein CJ255_15565 [Candidatus Viridilinea mediisalina]|uniref:SCP domain-containing protein n=2 Tax=Candidatus Viridilinea mediisalina TaxID=2024553 RepID=A0A2A6RGY0_9CHLR|nr:hypothetical protein CJ255_15565 [Candidatus Viridilinea mediisalina]
MRLTVQYFERRRFELHDANTVLLGLLGREVRSGPTNPPHDPSPPSAPSPNPDDVHPFVSEVVVLTNQARQANGCAVTLTMNPLLNQAAQSHSEDMARRNYFSHFSPEGTSLSDRVTMTGYAWQAVAENIGAGYLTPTQVVAGWMSSPGHRANILNCNYTEIGVGYAEANDDSAAFVTYWTQVFARPR